MAALVREAEAVLAYCESEQGCVLVVETSGSAYGAKRANDAVKFLTGQTLAQTGTRNLKIQPRIKNEWTG